MKKFSELFEPKPKGEKDFYHLHDPEKIFPVDDDVKKTDDDMFNASNVKAFDRKKYRYGAKPLEDTNGEYCESEQLDEAKIAKFDAKEILNNLSNHDFHALRSDEVSHLLDKAKKLGYNKSKNASGSYARMFHQHLKRLVNEEDIQETFGVYDSKIKKIISKHTSSDSAHDAARTTNFAHWHKTEIPNRYKIVNVAGYLNQPNKGVKKKV